MKTKLTLVLLCVAGLALAAVPARWAAEASRRVAPVIDVFQGETRALFPDMQAYGEPVTNATYQLFYQTNGMGREFWSGPITNALPVLFTPDLDCGAAMYTFFIQARDAEGDISYRANGFLQMLPSPGFSPNVIDRPRQFLDFSATAFTNAPWVLPAALTIYETKTNAAEQIDALRNDTTQAIAAAIAPLATTQQIAAAIALLATTQGVQNAIATAIVALPTTQTMHQAISTAVAPLASTQAVAAAVAPLATTLAVSAAVAPLASTQAVAAAVAPLASTQFVSGAISQSMATQSIIRLVNATNTLVRYELTPESLRTYTVTATTGLVVGVSIEDDSYVIKPSFYPVRIPWSGIAGPYSIETFYNEFGDGFVRISQDATSWLQNCGADITFDFTEFRLESGDSELLIPTIQNIVVWSTNETTKTFATTVDISAHDSDQTAHPSVQYKLNNLPEQSRIIMTDLYSTNNTRVVLSWSNGMLRAQGIVQ